MNTIHVNSETLGLLFTTKHPTSVPLCEPEFHSHFRPHTHQHTIYFIIYEINTQNSPYSHGLSNGLPKISIIRSQVLGPIKRPLNSSNQLKHHKTLKQSVTSSRIKPLPHGVCRNSLKPEPTSCPRRVERLSFLLRRILTVRSPGKLERSLFLSL